MTIIWRLSVINFAILNDHEADNRQKSAKLRRAALLYFRQALSHPFGIT